MTWVIPMSLAVDDDAEHIGRRTVAAEQDEIVEFGILDGDRALDAVVDRHLTVLRRAQADDVRDRRVAVVAVAPRAADAERNALFLRLGAHRGEFVLRQVAAIGLALRKQVVRDLGMARRALIDQARRPNRGRATAFVEDRVDRGVGRARAVGVLDAEQELATVVAREQPVEQRGARAADR